MGIRKTLGGDRLGTGKKQQIQLHGYERSNHDLGYLFRTTMAAGTLVPFMKQVALPGDTFDINLDARVLTHPTVGPLFGSYKVQLDTFLIPWRLYIAPLHNNKLKVGLNMSQIKLPTITLTALSTTSSTITDLDNCQINPSCLLSYLGIRGIGATNMPVERTFNALPILMYWDIVKNYYSNKQEEIGAVIHTPSVPLITTVTAIKIDGNTLAQAPGTNIRPVNTTTIVTIEYTGTPPDPNQIQVKLHTEGLEILAAVTQTWTDDGTKLEAQVIPEIDGDAFNNWDYRSATTPDTGMPKIATFPLDFIDQMRESILQANPAAPFDISTPGLTPYKWLSEQPEGIPNALSSQEGLALKTYQSDLFNNWLQTDWIDGTEGINEVTKIDVTSGYLKIDQINLSKKVYNVLNRVAVSGGTYKDWLDVTYDHPVPWIPESPIYMGGMSQELVFQEVISNTGTSDQPLGTLAGRGTLTNNKKGGNITINVDEPSYIMGIVSITPRLDYSQGNDWDVSRLKTMNDPHMPELDEIGFQELITEQMHWASTHYDGTKWVEKSAGKQPAWINYMTNVNKVGGNFAIDTNEMFMTLNRRYEIDTSTHSIKDLTTYIDPSKFNHIFAETALDAQNFWTQIAVNIEARRKMSAKVMPNL